MVSTLYKENSLNVEYVSGFLGTEDADAYLTQLKDLPFFQPTLKIRGKSVKPNRLSLAYGDPGLTYAFSGTEIPAVPWSPLMLELRDRVEKFVGCSFNYVLLNLYPDGSSSIAQHKDNEPRLNATFPIVVLSFGAERTIDFKKAQVPTTSIKLEHGSLYCMQRPTNKLFTHGIAADPSVKSLRISLTFRHLLPASEFPPAKKPRLASIDENSDFSSSNESHAELNQDEWLSNFLKQEENSRPILAEWSLNWSAFLQIVLDQNQKLRVHIRVFKETSNGDLRPTKKGIIMTIKTWDHFRSKVQQLKFESVNETFVSNNHLLVACICEKFCVLQQLFPFNTEGFFLKPSVLKLSDDQIYRLCDYTSEITESIIKAMLMVQLPKLLQKTSNACTNHLSDVENAKTFLFNCITHETEDCANVLFHCIGCEFNSNEQLSHECMTRTIFEKFQLNRQSIFLHLNLNNIVNTVKNECTCFFNATFFSMYTFNEIESFICDMFTLKEKKNL